MKLSFSILSCLVFVAVVLGGPIAELRAGRWPGENLPAPAWTEVRSGAYVDAVERSLEARTSLEDLIRPRYNEARYLAFGATEQGVVVGPGGWLFLGQQLVEPGDANRRAMARSVRAMGRIQALFAERGVTLVHALLPRAQTVYPDEIPRGMDPPHVPLYGELRQALLDAGVIVPDLVPALQASEERTHLDNDAHWRPIGAHVAARELARFLREDVLEGRPVPGRPVDTRFVRLDPEPFVGQHLKRLGFTDGGFLERRFVDEIERFDVVDAQDPKTILRGAADQQPIQVVGTSMSTPPYWFGAQLIGFLGVDVSVHAKAGYPTGYRMLDRVRLWATGQEPWPEIVIWEIPEDFLPWQGAYIFEPFESIAEVLEAAPFEATPIPFERVQVTGFARETRTEQGVSGRAGPNASLVLQLEEDELLSAGDGLVVEATIPPMAPPHMTMLTVRVFGVDDPAGEPLGERTVRLQATRFLHPVVVLPALEDGQRVGRIEVAPTDRAAWIQVGGIELWHARSEQDQDR